ncbi:DNA-binding response regulator [Spirochaetia bacterium]|nr:DNA-binding response regulator [Spirochaetia bacterium]
MVKQIKVLLIEDQIILRDALKKLLDGIGYITVAGVSGDAAEAPALCRELQPNLVLMDVLTENGSNGIVYAAEIRKEMPGIKIIAMTSIPEITFIEAARKAGIHSFMYKNSTADYLRIVIDETMSGHGIYPGPADEYSFQYKFNETEIAIIRCVCNGLDRGEIAAALRMSESNLKRLIRNILDKTGFDSILKFAVYAVGKQLIITDLKQPESAGGAAPPSPRRLAQKNSHEVPKK